MTLVTLMTLNQAISYTKITIKTDENQIMDRFIFNKKEQINKIRFRYIFIRF